MKTVYLFVGPPGSGKSTAALKSDRAIYINQDTQGKEFLNLFHFAVKDGYKDIIVDRMNFNKQQRRQFILAAKENGYRVEVYIFRTPTRECYARVLERENHPTILTIEDFRKATKHFFRFYEEPSMEEGIDNITVIKQNNDKYDAIIVDLDGTLCDISHRQHHVCGEKKNWPAFFAGISDDKVNHLVKQTVEFWRTEKEVEVILCSGRGEEYRKVTEEWLDKHKIRYATLFMRPAKDSRNDALIKEIILDWQILPDYNPILALDDRNRVVEMWRRRGITTFQVAEGDF